jgi:hypothetical protein
MIYEACETCAVVSLVFWHTSTVTRRYSPIRQTKLRSTYLVIKRLHRIIGLSRTATREPRQAMASLGGIAWLRKRKGEPVANEAWSLAMARPRAAVPMCDRCGRPDGSGHCLYLAVQPNWFQLREPMT